MPGCGVEHDKVDTHKDGATYYDARAHIATAGMNAAAVPFESVYIDELPAQESKFSQNEAKDGERYMDMVNYARLGMPVHLSHSKTPTPPAKPRIACRSLTEGRHPGTLHLAPHGGVCGRSKLPPEKSLSFIFSVYSRVCVVAAATSRAAVSFLGLRVSAATTAACLRKVVLVLSVLRLLLYYSPSTAPVLSLARASGKITVILYQSLNSTVVACAERVSITTLARCRRF